MLLINLLAPSNSLGHLGRVREDILDLFCKILHTSKLEED